MIGMSDEEIAKFATASEHHYGCRCKLCKEWWKAMGPEMEDDETPDGYGPFSDDEMEE